MKRAFLAPIIVLAGGLAVSTGCDRKQISRYRASADLGLRAEYYRFNSTADPWLFQQRLLTRVDRQVDFDYGDAAPAPGVPADRFAVRWTGYLVPPKSGRMTLCTCSDDGVRLTIDGELKIDQMDAQAARFWGTQVDLVAGRQHAIRLDYFDAGGSAKARLYWSEQLGNGWEDVCRNINPVTDPLNPPAPESCQDADQLNPALQIIPADYFIPAGDEADQVLAACQAPSRLLDPAQAPDPASPNTQRARRLFQRLGGLDLPLFDARIAEVKALLDQGKSREAARRVTAQPSFYDKTVRSFAARLSTRAERPDAPLNDFIATVVGVTRDGIDARKLLTGDFLYRANPALFWNDNSIYSRQFLVESNQHYEVLDSMQAPLACALDRLDWNALSALPEHMKQLVVDPTSPRSQRTNPDPAGVLTSRAWSEAHMIAGTNRRPVQKAFEQFLCAPIDSWRDAEISDEFIGRDVERFPNGPTSFPEFQSTCKTCHAPLDALRGAFAAFNFENGVLKHAPAFIERGRFESVNNAAETDNRMKLTASCQEGDPACDPNRNPRLPVAWKLNHNVSYPAGHFTKDSSYTNLLVTPRHMLRFGWSGGLTGRGAREFGRMLSNSRAFPTCMARRAYAEVCKDDPFRADFPPEASQWLDQVGDEFARGGYNLRALFESLATTCME